jgi:DNA-directed RNA polymerase subunit RPC12/RpoP
MPAANLLAQPADLSQYAERKSKLTAKMVVTAKCSQCGAQFEAEIEERSALCPKCGREVWLNMPQVPVPPAPTLPTAGFFAQMKPCEYCKQQISRAAVFCPHCGGFKSIPFQLVWQAVCAFVVASVLVGLLLGFFAAAFHSIFGR